MDVFKSTINLSSIASALMNASIHLIVKADFKVVILKFISYYAFDCFVVHAKRYRLKVNNYPAKCDG